MPCLLQQNVGICHRSRVLPFRSKRFTNFGNIGHIEIAAQNQCLGCPVTASQMRMNVRKPAFSGGTVTKVSHIHIPHERSIFGTVSVYRAVYGIKNFIDGIVSGFAVPKYVFFPRHCFCINTSQPRSLLSPVVLFLHQKEQFLQPVRPAAVFILIISGRLFQTYDGNAAFMLQRFHGCKNKILYLFLSFS